jgi:hypothetical protein
VNTSFQIGYRLHRQIGKALQRHSEVIKNAISHYNMQATKLDPPHPPLTWKEIVDYSFIGEFDTLRHSHSDVCSQPWAQTMRHEATVKYFKLCRAQEEVAWLNIEICRLRTSIHDETIHTQRTISLLLTTNTELAVELQHQWKLRNLSTVSIFSIWMQSRIRPCTQVSVE